MSQVLIRKLGEDTLAAYRAAAKASGRSLEAELRDLIERNRPLRKKSAQELLAMSERACSLTVGGGSSDSTPYIRSVRDTDVGQAGDPAAEASE